MKKLTFMLGIALIIFFGCTKNNSTVTEENDPPATRAGNKVFFYNDVEVDSIDIDWDSDSLNIVKGYTHSDTIIAFESDAELIEWANTIQGGDFLTELLDLKEEALRVADSLGEFEYEEHYGDVSREYQEYLDGLVHNQSRGVTKLWEDIGCIGTYTQIWTPKANLKSWSNRASSTYTVFFGHFLADFKWWGGRKVFTFLIAGDAYCYNLEEDDFNDKASSIWIY